MVYDPEVVSFLSGEVARYKRLAAERDRLGDSENSKFFIIQGVAIMSVAEEYSRKALRKPSPAYVPHFHGELAEDERTG